MRALISNDSQCLTLFVFSYPCCEEKETVKVPFSAELYTVTFLSLFLFFYFFTSYIALLSVYTLLQWYCQLEMCPGNFRFNQVQILRTKENPCKLTLPERDWFPLLSEGLPRRRFMMISLDSERLQVIMSSCQVLAAISSSDAIAKIAS